MKKIFGSIDKRRLIGMILGNILIGIGVSVFKLSGMGNDPYSAMCLSVSNTLKLSYSTYMITLNCFIFIIELIFGRKYIGLGTIVNWFLVGYVVEFFIWLTNTFITPPEAFLMRLPIVILGVIILSLGVSFYQTSDAGIAPYDSLSLISRDRLPIPYFWCRIFFDALCTVVTLLTGGLIGLGTFICAFGLGPIIHFFNEKISKKVIYKNK